MTRAMLKGVVAVAATGAVLISSGGLAAASGKPLHHHQRAFYAHKYEHIVQPYNRAVRALDYVGGVDTVAQKAAAVHHVGNVLLKVEHRLYAARWPGYVRADMVQLSYAAENLGYDLQDYPNMSGEKHDAHAVKHWTGVVHADLHIAK